MYSIEHRLLNDTTEKKQKGGSKNEDNMQHNENDADDNGDDDANVALSSRTRHDPKKGRCGGAM